MAKSTDELRSIISTWNAIGSDWNDTKSKDIEETIISKLESALWEIDEQIESMMLFGLQTEKQIEEIERSSETIYESGYCS